MWLQGGPGCASTIGMHTEFGPYKVDCSTNPCTEVERVNSWNDHMHLLVVDQPVGTGYSFAFSKEERVTTTDLAAEYLYYAVRQWYDIKNADCDNTKFQKNDFHIFGESFAGHWIPGTAYEFLHQNEKENQTFIIPLKSKDFSESVYIIRNCCW